MDFSSVLGKETLKQFGIVQEGSMQGIRHIYYDTAQYTTGTTTTLDFFNTARSSNALDYYTNFTQDGKIVASEAFIVTGISIAFSTGIYNTITAQSTAGPIAGSYNDLQMLLFYGNLLFKLAYKEYGPFPLWRIGGGGGVYGGASVTTTATSAQYLASWGSNGVPATSNIYDVVYALPGSVSVSCHLRWGTSQTTTTSPYIKVMLDGWLLRPVG